MPTLFCEKIGKPILNKTKKKIKIIKGNKNSIRKILVTRSNILLK
jgi:hypothetical protein